MAIVQVRAEEPATANFERTWARTDRPVADLIVSRTWMWGPEANTPGIVEPYEEAPGNARTVQYFDKSRMEDNSYRTDGPPWDVTNGLLVVELVTGKLQLGDNTFEEHEPATVNVAGDADDPTGPTYKTFGSILDRQPSEIGTTVIQTLDRQGNIEAAPDYASYGVTIGHIDEVTNHGVAAPFWNFMNSSGTTFQNGNYVDALLFPNAVYATGRPITEPYWASVKVGGTYVDVLTQCFERRCLTYNPANSPGWQVEAGNVGQHYYAWRYGQIPDEATPTATTTATATETVTQTETETPTGTVTVTESATASETETATETMTETVTETETVTVTETATETVTETATETVEPLAEPPLLYVSDVGNDRVQLLEADGPYVSEWSSGGDFDFQDPYGIAVDGEGYVYVIDRSDRRILKFDMFGQYVTTWKTFNADDQIAGIAVGGPLDRVYVTEWERDEVHMYSKDGQFLGAFGTTGIQLTQFNTPMGIAADSTGIYVADYGNHRIQKFSGAGDFLDAWGSEGSGDEQFSFPFGVAVDSAGNVYVGDSFNNRIQKLDSDGNFVLNWGASEQIRDSSTSPGVLPSIAPGMSTSPTR
ncbi:MAG: hypothetical protein R2849_17975 [Thermomicrobiales bacterium]